MRFTITAEIYAAIHEVNGKKVASWTYEVCKPIRIFCCYESLSLMCLYFIWRYYSQSGNLPGGV